MAELLKSRLVALAIVIRLQVVGGPLVAGGAPMDRTNVGLREGFVRLVEVIKSSAAVGGREATFLGETIIVVRYMLGPLLEAGP